MKPNLFFILIITLLSTGLFSQKIVDVDLSQKFKKYNTHRLDVNATLPMLRDDNFTLDLQIGNKVYQVALQNSGIISDDYKMIAIDDNGQNYINDNMPRPYNGYLLGTSHSRVSLTFNNDFIYGFIREGDKTMYIEPLRYYQSDASMDEFITYDVSDVIEDSSHKCGVEKEQHRYRQEHSSAEGQRVVGECFEVEWAIVSDFQMFQDFGSVFEVEDHNIGVANDIQTNYDDEFADEIQYEIVEQQVFTTAASDPFTTSNDAGTLLDDFTSWGPSGFNSIHDVGSIWTGRNFNGGTIGIAWVGAICTGFRYNALENFTTNGNTKRVMVAHELGHNFDCFHDDNNSPHIMRPSVSTSTTWSSTSIDAVENFLGQIGCLANCPASGSAPISDFITTVTDECVPASVIYTDISVDNPTSWLWTFEGGTPSTSTAQNPTVTYNEAGVFDVTLEVSNAFGTDILTKTDEVEIFDVPVAEWFVTTDELLAIFNNNSLNGDSYFWDFGDGTFNSSENPIHNYTQDGVYTVTMTVSNNCGSDTYIENVEIVTLPTADFSATPLDGCTPQSIAFSDLSSDNTTGWSWEFEGGVPATSTAPNPTVTYNTSGIYDVTLTVTNNSGADQITKSDYITIIDPATSDFNFTVDGGDVTFENTSTNADDFAWEFGNGETSTDENPMYTYDASGTYNVVLSATNSCGTVTDTQSVVISLAPVAGFTTVGSPTDCAEFSLEFTDVSTFDPTAWTWTFEGGTPATSTDQNPTVTYSTPGAYDVSLTVTNAQGSNTTSVDDYVVAQDQVAAGFDFTEVGLEVSFDNQSSDAGMSYVWDFGDGMTSTGTNPIYTYAEEGIYEVTLTATGPCNSDVISQMVNLYTTPTSGFSSDVTDGCSDLTVSYTQSASINVTSYSWTFEGGTPATSTDPNPTVVYDAAGDYNVELVVSNPAGSASASEIDFVTVSDIPSVSFVAVNNLLSVTFTNNSQNASSFAWDFGDGNTSTEANPTHTYDTEGNYDVSLIATNECGDATITNTVGANALPSANASASNTAICEGGEVEFEDMSSDNVTAWAWTFEGATPSTSTDQNPVVVYNQEGTYDVTLTVTAAAGTDVIDFTNFITVTALPTSEFVAVNNMQEVTFTNSSTGATSYAWDFGDGNTSTDINPIHTYTSEGMYTVTLTATNQCGDVVTTQTIAANSMPTANGGSDTTFGCGNIEIQFTDSSSDNVTSWLWTFEGGNPATSTDQNPVIFYSAPGVYDVSLEVTSEGGTSEVTYDDYITIEGIPTAEFDFSADDLDYTFTYTGVEGDVFNWDFGDGNTSDAMNPTHTYLDYGIYNVTLIVSNACSDAVNEQEVNIISSVTDLGTITDLRIFPNPAKDLFFIEMELAESIDLQMQIMDIHGRVVQLENMTNLGSQVNKSIDLSDEPSGTYLLRFINGDQVRNAKIVLQR